MTTVHKPKALTVDESWELLWLPMVMDNGKMDAETVKVLLHDYGVLLNNNAILFPYLTANRIRDPQHDLEEVIQIADECTANDVDEGVRQVLDIVFDHANETVDQPAEVRLTKLLDLLSTIYEQGVEHV